VAAALIRTHLEMLGSYELIRHGSLTAPAALTARSPSGQLQGWDRRLQARQDAAARHSLTVRERQVFLKKHTGLELLAKSRPRQGPLDPALRFRNRRQEPPRQTVAEPCEHNAPNSGIAATTAARRSPRDASKRC
jgi:hypothetical protein